MPSNSRKSLWPTKRGDNLKCLRYHESPLYVPRSPPLCEMIVRKESMSLKVCGVLIVTHLASSKLGISAPGTSSRMNFQSRLRFNLARGDCGGAYEDGTSAKRPTANRGLAGLNSVGRVAVAN